MYTGSADPSQRNIIKGAILDIRDWYDPGEDPEFQLQGLGCQPDEEYSIVQRIEQEEAEEADKDSGLPDDSNT